MIPTSSVINLGDLCFNNVQIGHSQAGPYHHVLAYSSPACSLISNVSSDSSLLLALAIVLNVLVGLPVLSDFWI